jgi:hypothetical protein
MLDVKVNGGLCSTCNNALSCFHRARRGPALFCELFDDHVRPELGANRRKVSPSPIPSAVLEAKDDDISKYEGLCVNCENRQTCAHPKPAGGVWHCENYR